MFLPTGIDRARELAGMSGADTGRVVAWCWAVNGFFSVIGSTATTMLSMTFGFDRTMLIGLVLYAIATAVMVTARRSEDVHVALIAADPVMSAT
jgi:Na+/melibiose symporter-like transporter